MGCDDSQKRRLGLWFNGGSMVNNYESAIPRQALHNIAGFMQSELYMVARTGVTPPPVLVDMVFLTLNKIISGYIDSNKTQ